MRAMEPISNCSTTPFPYYELHQVPHSINETTTPSAMDILCEIVNSEYSDIGFNMEPPIGVRADEAHDHHIEKESFLDILYSSGSKAMKIVDDEVEMVHEHHAPSNNYNIQFNAIASPSGNSMHHEFSSPDMHHFKLPLLEQEPETSINNSHLDEKLKHKEIRRNLERSMMMHQGASVSQQSLAPSHHIVKHVEMHETSSCSRSMVNYEECNHVQENAMGDKVIRRRAGRPNGIIGSSDEKCKEDRATRPSVDDHHAAKLKRKAGSALKHNIDSGSKKSTSCEARMKHIATASCGQGSQFERSHAHLHHPDERDDSSKRTRVHSPLANRIDSGGDRLSLANDGQKILRVESSLGSDGQMSVRGESSLVNDGLGSASAEKAKVGGGGPRMTHISVERNRRKQMNEHLAILRSLMPTSYVQRSDQASIIGGVVEFIKELQQLLASLETQKRRRAYVAEALSPRVSAGSAGPSPRGSLVTQPSPRGTTQELVATSRSPLADVEVKLAGGAHVLLRTLSHKATRGQLLHLIAALECMSLQILHLNITTLQEAVLYTFTLKIGIECRLSVDDLADVGQQIFKDIHARKLAL